MKPMQMWLTPEHPVIRDLELVGLHDWLVVESHANMLIIPPPDASLSDAARAKEIVRTGRKLLCLAHRLERQGYRATISMRNDRLPCFPLYPAYTITWI